MDSNHFENIQVNNDSPIEYKWIGNNNDEYIKRLRFVFNKPFIKSKINIKAVVKDKAKFNVEAIIVVNKGAKNIDSYLSIKVLLLSDNAFARAVPSLEIKENDVKAGHSATITHIDKRDIYYLQSRGLSKETSEQLLIESFMN